MLNQIQLMGRLTRDPELRQTNNNTAVANFSLAVDRDLKDKATGDRVTDFIDCVAWGHTANFVQKYCSKGNLIAATGRLQIRDWTDKDGNKRRSAEVNVDNVYFAEKKGDNSTSDSDSDKAPVNTAPAAIAEDDSESDLPF